MSKIQFLITFGLILVLLANLLSGCDTRIPETSVWTPQSPTRTTTLKPTIGDLQKSVTTPIPSSTVTPIHSATPTATTLPQLCSPLADIDLKMLPELITNPFAPPPPGSDLPHQGVDLSLVDPVAGYALEGHLVQASLAGEVAAVILDRFPYGYALLIETPDQTVPPFIRNNMAWPTPLPQLMTPDSLTCPPPETSHTNEAGSKQEPNNQVKLQTRSIYILYAHLQGLTDLELGDQVQCGQPLGRVGVSGNALHPHLHIEIRVGPSGFRFDSMAHYDNSATQAEITNYCTWRVNGSFQLVDPMVIFSLAPSN